MPLIRVGTLAEVPPGTVMEFMVGDRPYAVCNVKGEIRALDGVCPHRGGPLGQGAMHHGHVVCPYHLWEFDSRTGEYDYNPALKIATFETRVEQGEIFVQAP